MLGIRKSMPSSYRSGFGSGRPNNMLILLTLLIFSVADPNPDPNVFEPSGSISQRYGSGTGSGSFYHQAKKGRKTLIPTALRLLFNFLSLKIMHMYLQEIKTKNFFFKLVFCWHLEIKDENCRIRIRIRIQ
jgi:hypothetical protein